MTTAVLTREAPQVTGRGKPRRGPRILADYRVGGQQRRLWALVSDDGIAVLDELRAPLDAGVDLRQVEPLLACWDEAEALARDYIAESAVYGEPPVTKKQRW